MTRASVLILLVLCMVSAGWAQKDKKNQKDKSEQGGASLQQQKPGEGGKEGGPAVTKE